jgi:membrane-bound metal-dependent hydrolase YbcI (DUF457 family)
MKDSTHKIIFWLNAAFFVGFLAVMPFEDLNGRIFGLPQVLSRVLRDTQSCAGAGLSVACLLVYHKRWIFPTVCITFYVLTILSELIRA